MVSTVYLTVLSLYLYVRFTGRSYDALFNEEDSFSNQFDSKRRASQLNNRTDLKVLKTQESIAEEEE